MIDRPDATPPTPARPTKVSIGDILLGRFALLPDGARISKHRIRHTENSVFLVEFDDGKTWRRFEHPDLVIALKDAMAHAVLSRTVPPVPREEWHGWPSE